MKIKRNKLLWYSVSRDPAHNGFTKLAPMKTFYLRPTLMYRSTLHETIKLSQASPRIALLWIGTAGLLAAAFLMWLFVTLLTMK
jgi:hypothetical protein